MGGGLTQITSDNKEESQVSTSNDILVYLGTKFINNKPIRDIYFFNLSTNKEFKFSDAERGAKSTMTSILGRMATYSGELIEWNQALNSGINLLPDNFDWNTMPKVLPDANGYYPVAIPGVTKYFS